MPASKEYYKQYYLKNKERILVNSKERYRKNPEQKAIYDRKRIRRLRAEQPELMRKRALKQRYGITYHDYYKLLEKQQFKCAICYTSRENLEKDLYVDHCHKSGKVRGLLCDSCNQGIGKFKDNIFFLLNAIRYLKRFFIP